MLVFRSFLVAGCQPSHRGDGCRALLGGADRAAIETVLGVRLLTDTVVATVNYEQLTAGAYTRSFFSST